MQTRRLLAAAALLAFLVLAPGCFLIVPEPHDDMRAQLESLALPPDFTLAESGHGGLRSGFAGASPPYVARWYAAPWDDGRLCGRLKNLAASAGSRSGRPAWSDNTGGVCNFEATVGAGWRGRLIGIGSYKLLLRASSRDVVRRYTTDAQCRDQLRRAGPDVPMMKLRASPCWLEPDEAVVMVRLTGEQMR